MNRVQTNKLTKSVIKLRIWRPTDSVDKQSYVESCRSNLIALKSAVDQTMLAVSIATWNAQHDLRR